MVLIWILGLIAALGLGIWVGLGWPGLKRGRSDRVVPSGRSRRLPANYIHWIRNKR
jgi:hypothetical protein